LATIDLAPAGPSAGLAVTTRGTRPRALSVAVAGPGEALRAAGELIAHHGPGRDELTFRIAWPPAEIVAMRLSIADAPVASIVAINAIVAPPPAPVELSPAPPRPP
jgi:hypothetical protein